MINMKSFKATIAISNHHIHLTKEIYDMLFDEEITLKNSLNQKGEFASNEVITIKGPKGEINNVRLVGPLRQYNQVEVSALDAYVLGLNPPVRKSGDIKNSAPITLITKKGEVTLDEACILAERHLHITPLEAKNLGLKNDDIINIKVNNLKGGIMQAFVKISDNAYFEVHIDRDDANAFLLKNGDIVEIFK